MALSSSHDVCKFYQNDVKNKPIISGITAGFTGGITGAVAFIYMYT